MQRRKKKVVVCYCYYCREKYKNQITFSLYWILGFFFVFVFVVFTEFMLVSIDPLWFLTNVLWFRLYFYYFDNFTNNRSPILCYIHFYLQNIDAFYKSRQQQRGYDGQKEYFKRKNVTDWIIFLSIMFAIVFLFIPFSTLCLICDSVVSTHFQLYTVGSHFSSNWQFDWAHFQYW